MTEQQSDPAGKPAARVQHPLRGIALMMAALLFIAALDATSKHLTRTVHIPVILWVRYVTHCLLMVIFLGPSMGTRLVATGRPITQLVRSLLALAISALIFSAFRFMPLAETTAIIYVSPLLVVVMAGPWLHEKIGLGRWLAVLAGFAGALLIARPGGGLSLYGVLLALGAAGCHSIYQILTRQIAATENTLTSLFYTALIGTIVMTAALPWLWRGPWPTPFEMLLLVSLGAYAACGHFLAISALSHAPASLLSPVMYVQLVWATLLGWQIFDHVPDIYSILGMLVVAGSGLAIVLLERRRARLAAESPTLALPE